MAKLKSYDHLDTSQEAAGGDFYTGEVPPAGSYKGVVKFVKVKQNRNGDDMLNVLVEIREPKSSKKSEFNGYGIWNNINVTDQGVPYVKAFFIAIGCDPDAFFKGVGSLDTTQDPPALVKVGRVKIDENPCIAVCKRSTYNDNDRLEVVRFLADEDPADDDDDDVEVIEDEDEDVTDDEGDEDDEDLEDDEEEDESEDDEDEDSDEDEEDEEEGDDEEPDYESMSIAELRALLREDHDWEPADYKGWTKADIIEWLTTDEDAEDEDEDADDAEDDDEPPF